MSYRSITSYSHWLYEVMAGCNGPIVGPNETMVRLVRVNELMLMSSLTLAH